MNQVQTNELTDDQLECDCDQLQDFDCDQMTEPVFEWKKIGLFILIPVILYLLISWIGGLDETYYLKAAELIDNGCYEEGVEYFRKSARMGGEEAYYALGRCYLDGLGVQKDTLEGMRLIMKSVSEAYAEAQYFLALCHYYGLYVDIDKELTVKYLKYASRQKHPDAQCALGVCYMNGEGVEKNVRKAYKCFIKAKKNGSTKADACIKSLVEQR